MKSAFYWPFLLLLLCAAAWCQVPDLLLRGTCQDADGKTAPLIWTVANLKADKTPDRLRFEVAPKVRGTADTASLPLQPLRIYTVTLTARRGPGTGLDIRVNWRQADNQPVNRQMVWQLTDHSRINWWPLSPYKNTYTQRFILPPGAHQVTMQIALTGNSDTAFNYFELCDLTIERSAEVPFGTTLGPNLLGSGDMERTNPDGMALGWGWWGAPSKAEVVQETADRTAHSGDRFLAIMPGQTCILADGLVPVEPGRAYRISFWARGKADLGLGAQLLNNDSATGLRIGDAQAHSFHVDTAAWQYFEQIWFAEAQRVQYANPFMGITPQAEIDLDDFAFQRIEP